jgi:DNA repair exonuclease SbcCD ATPase subunit
VLYVIILAILCNSALSGDTIEEKSIRIEEPEKLIVKKYFQAIKGNDRDVLNTLALEPRLIPNKTFEVISMQGPQVVEFVLPMLMKEQGELTKKRKARIMDVLDKMDDVTDWEDELAENPERKDKEKLQKKITKYKQDVESLKEEIKRIQANINEVKKVIATEKEIFHLSMGTKDAVEMSRFLDKYHVDEVKHRIRVRVKTAGGDNNDYDFLLRRIVLKSGEGQIVKTGRLIIVDILNL